jgi:hypothetical protein
MAYERYDPEERRWRDEDDRRAMDWDRERGDPASRGDYGRERGGRGFFGRMGDEMRSWFEDDREGDYRRDRDEERWQPTMGSRDYNPRYEDEMEGRTSRMRSNDRGQRFDEGTGTEWDRDPYRRTSFAGSRARSNHDLHYEEWRRQQMEDLDRDYDEYRHERQSRFEEDFGGWRDRRKSKRELLRGIREHMEVVGSDDKHVGTVDRIAGDRIILTRSDPQSGGVHHSLSCTDVDRVDNDRVVLDCTADKARERWRDESRGRALFEREDQGRAGPHILDRSFSGTYR